MRALLGLSWDVQNKDAGSPPGWKKIQSDRETAPALVPGSEGRERASERVSRVSHTAPTGPGDRSSMCPVVGHFLLSVELGSQLGGMKRCLDAVADGLQPSYFSPLHQLLKNTLLSKLGAVFAFLKVVPAFLHSLLGSEFRSCLAKIPALLVVWARALAPVLVVRCPGRK